MENNTALVLKQDGNIYVMNMPEKPNQYLSVYDLNGQKYKMGQEAWHAYDKAVEQALSSAVLCADQEQAKRIVMQFLNDQPLGQGMIESNKPWIIPGLTFTPKEHCDAYHQHDKPSCFVALLSLQEKTEKQEDNNNTNSPIS